MVMRKYRNWGHWTTLFNFFGMSNQVFPILHSEFHDHFYAFPSRLKMVLDPNTSH